MFAKEDENKNFEIPPNFKLKFLIQDLILTIDMDSSFSQALKAGQLKSYLEFNPEAIGWRDGDGCTPLHLVVRTGDLEALKALLAMPSGRACLNFQDDHGWSPLHFAAARERGMK